MNFSCTCKFAGIIKLFDARRRENLQRGITSHMWDVVRTDFMAVSCPQSF